ncbi:cyclopropane fatty acyl phospholipid synthase [Vibrio tritonius]|uniref:cyclopropane fatty acyl phospholipid synthase n=1 Tax=Vibrio tritonius TaxID=1435069 RepID=UPI00315DD4CC
MILSNPIDQHGLQSLFEDLLKDTDIEINGSRPWDVKVLDNAFYSRVFRQGSLGLGESYMDGMWECEQIDELISRVLRHDLEAHLDNKAKFKIGLNVAGAKLRDFVNPQSINRAKEDVSSHYDLGNDLFQKMLDKRMTYTCGYWHHVETLDEAQEAKLDLICRKAGLKPGMRVLDIGCGWGSFMNYAAEKYGVICDGITLSHEQAALGQQIADDKRLPVSFVLQDYREYQPKEKYDRIISVGMIEHVGPSNYDEYFRCAKRMLKDDGLFVLHTIGGKESADKTDPWIDKYIFPNGVCPSFVQLAQAVENKFVIEDVHNIGESYDKTLVAWCENFDNAWSELAEKYGERFRRMWRYYLLSCAGAFRARNINVWQFVLSHENLSQPTYVRQI